MEQPGNNESKALDWKESLLWLLLAVGAFNAAYASTKHPLTGLLIFGYAYGLVQLTNQPGVRRAFYFGLATGFLCYAPQLYFFWNIFGPAALVLWLVLAFWIGLFAAIVCGSIRRWGKARAAWLIPIVWTGIEYFRSELYYLKFSWLNAGYAMPLGSELFGMYGVGLLIFALAAFLFQWRQIKMSLLKSLSLVAVLAVLFGISHGYSGSRRPPTQINLAGVQLEFPPPGIIPKILDQALAKHANAAIFVLSEYTLDGPVPDSLKNWCRKHSRFLVVGGKDPVGPNDYYNTVFVVSPNGDIVFKQAKCVPIQFFKDGLPAPEQKVWNSPWGKIGFCICYDLSYTRVTDELIRQGAQLLIVPTMDVEEWGRHEHELHSRVAPVRAAEYGIPIFRVASSGISQAVSGGGDIIAQAPMPGNGEIFSAQLRLPLHSSLPLDRWLAPICTGIIAMVTAVLLLLEWQHRRAKNARAAKGKTNYVPG